MTTLIISGASRGINAGLARPAVAAGHAVTATNVRSGEVPTGARTVLCDLADARSVAQV